MNFPSTKDAIVAGIADGLSKYAQEDTEAKGIPERGKKSDPPQVPRRKGKSEIWEASVQKHDAEDAGTHYDLRLGRTTDKTGLSWALPKGLPTPGEKNLAIQTDDHLLDYFDFEGEIESGYGKGEVELDRREKAEVLKSQPNKVRFNLYPSNETEEFDLVKMDEKEDNWLLINKTPTREQKGDIPSSRPDYKDVDPDNINMDNQDQIMSPKIDGSHVLFDLEPGKNVRVYSYRPAKRDTGLINHTWRVPRLINKTVPEDMPRTLLRGELWAQEKDKDQPLPANRLGGILNSNVFKSRAKQQEEGEVIPTVFDVAKYADQWVEDSPYDDKESIIKEVKMRMPEFHSPNKAKSKRKKETMYEKIRKGEHPETKEGVVIWNRKSGENPMKVKFTPEYDVKIEEIFPAEPGTKYEGSHAGGFVYSWPDDSGRKVGRVGTGFSDELRKDMWKNPERYEDKIAKVTALDVYKDKENPDKKGALRAPSFQGWHLDKNQKVPPVTK